ncbi:MAG: efflux RND transporter permease subunit [Candidatus Zixiibacteriota bacterium]|nr:MAG: efflux RND transporter permease subunit [candidate division Zixibacteria bacterium]
MKLAEVSIRRPVFTVMMVVALVVLGYSSFKDMNTDLMPEIDFPFVIVETVYPGASAEAVETDVSKPIEDAVNPIEGIKHVTSISQESYSLVFAEFMLEKDGREAAQEAREKVAAIRDDLPQEIEEPIVARFDPHSEPIISITISGERPLRDITEYIMDDIQKRLEAIPGVGAVTLVGGFEREINIFLDIDKMESYEISIDKVRSAIQTANLEIPGGRVNEKNQEYLVRTMGKLGSVDQFNNIAIDNPNGHPVYLYDIATVVDGVEEQRSLARVDGKDAITLGVSRQSGANTVEIARAIKAEVARIRQVLPPDMRIDIVVDQSTFIEDSIHEVLLNIFYGGLLAVLVIFLFLADIRSTIISAIAIPASIIATFTFMKALGFTLNILSLLALAIAVGLLIDDAIVVIENIFRRLQGGESPMKAAFNGTKEIGLAVTATTFSIVVVFLPVAFMKGIVGRFFYQFGMTVAFSVVVSLFIAFSLTPMLSSRFLRKEGETAPPPTFFLFRWLHGLYLIVLKAIRPWNIVFNRVNHYYGFLLRWSLNHRWIVLLFAGVTFILALYLGRLAGVEFQPETDQGEFTMSVETPPGTDLETTSAKAFEVENLLRSSFEGIKLVFTTIGSGQNPVNEGQVFVKLVDKDQRPLSARQMMDSARTVITQIPGIKYSVGRGEQMGSNKSVEVSIRGNNLDILTDLTRKVEDIYRRTPGVVDLDNSLQEGKPELQVSIDRDMANDLGLNVYQIGSSIRTLVEGDVVTRYKEGDKEYNVRIRLREEDRTNTAQVGRLLVASDKDVEGRRSFLVPLSYVASLDKAFAIGEYNRYDRLREVRVGSNVAADAFAGTVVDQIMEQVQQIDIPPGYHIGKTGVAEIQEESFGYIFEALFLAVVFIYLLLASQFESFFDAFAIMFSLPLSLVGAIVALLIMGDSISIISLIGIIMLMGLVTKNAILLIDFIKQNRYRGVERTEAILIAGPIRLRPILMTTLSLIFGVMPIALGIGPGAELRAPMARAVIGGMTSSTVLTLVVVPVVYTVIDDIVAFFKGRETVEVRKESLESASTTD